MASRKSPSPIFTQSDGSGIFAPRMWVNSAANDPSSHSRVPILRFHTAVTAFPFLPEPAEETPKSKRFFPRKRTTGAPA